MTVYCPGCGQPLYKVAKGEKGKQICPNPKCKIAIVGNATYDPPKEA